MGSIIEKILSAVHTGVVKFRHRHDRHRAVEPHRIARQRSRDRLPRPPDPRSHPQSRTHRHYDRTQYRDVDEDERGPSPDIRDSVSSSGTRDSDSSFRYSESSIHRENGSIDGNDRRYEDSHDKIYRGRRRERDDDYAGENSRSLADREHVHDYPGRHVHFSPVRWRKRNSPLPAVSLRSQEQIRKNSGDRDGSSLTDSDDHSGSGDPNNSASFACNGAATRDEVLLGDVVVVSGDSVTPNTHDSCPDSIEIGSNPDSDNEIDEWEDWDEYERRKKERKRKKEKRKKEVMPTNQTPVGHCTPRSSAQDKANVDNLNRPMSAVSTAPSWLEEVISPYVDSVPRSTEAARGPITGVGNNDSKLKQRVDSFSRSRSVSPKTVPHIGKEDDDERESPERPSRQAIREGKRPENPVDLGQIIVEKYCTPQLGRNFSIRRKPVGSAPSRKLTTACPTSNVNLDPRDPVTFSGPNGSSSRDPAAIADLIGIAEMLANTAGVFDESSGTGTGNKLPGSEEGSCKFLE